MSAPLAPTVTPQTQTRDVTDWTDPEAAAVVHWAHNPTDGQPGVQATVRHRVVGADPSTGTAWPWYTANIDDWKTSFSFVGAAGTTEEIQVRTASQVGVFGPWSASVRAAFDAVWKLADSRALVFCIGRERMVMPGGGQWGAQWMRDHPWVLSPLTITRSRQGSLGDPEAATCTFSVVVPTSAKSSQDGISAPWASTGGVPPFSADVLVTSPDPQSGSEYIFFGTIETLVQSDDEVRLTSGETIPARRIDVTATSLLATLERAKIGLDASDNIGDYTASSRARAAADAAQAVTGRTWDTRFFSLDTLSFVDFDRDIDSASALGFIRQTVACADFIVVEQADRFALVHRREITEAPYVWRTATAPYRHDRDDVIHLDASAVPTPTGWVIDRAGVVTRFAMTFVAETVDPEWIAAHPDDHPGQHYPTSQKNQPDGFWERGEATRAVENVQAGIDYGVSTWQVTGDAVESPRSMLGSTTVGGYAVGNVAAGGPDNAEIRGRMVQHVADPQWRPDGDVVPILDRTRTALLRKVVYAHRAPWGWPLVVIDGAPAERSMYRVVGATVALGHPADESVSLTLEHHLLGLPTGLRLSDVPPAVTISDMQASAMTWLDCCTCDRIEKG